MGLSVCQKAAKADYERYNPQKNLLYQIIQRHWQIFAALANCKPIRCQILSRRNLKHICAAVFWSMALPASIARNAVMIV